MVDLETRDLEYFVAVAEELHFGRAAANLHIAQPALSKAVQRLESRLGVSLLLRSSRNVSLTPAGEALLLNGRHALDAVRAAAARTRRAGISHAHIRLVLKPGGDAGLLPAILSAYADQPNARGVDILFGTVGDRADHLRDGRADVALLYEPFDDLAQLAYEVVHTEGRVAVLPVDHRLANHDRIHVADLEGEVRPRWTGLSGSGSGPEIADVPQLAHLVVLGQTIAVLPKSLIDPAPPGVVLIPVLDAAPSHVVLAWSAQDERRYVADFVAAAIATVVPCDGGESASPPSAG